MLISWKFVGNNFAFIFSDTRHLKENVSPNNFHLRHFSLISPSNHFFLLFLMLKKLLFVFWIYNHRGKFTKINDTLALRHGVLNLKLKMIKRIKILSNKQNSWTFIFWCYECLILRNFVVLLIDVNYGKLKVNFLNFRL